MNFKQICESVLEESDGRAVQLASVALGRDTNDDLYLTEPTHRNVVKWVAEEYQRIQLLSPFWEFHHKRGTFLTLRANKASYKKAGIRGDADLNSFYFVPSSNTSLHYPLTIQSYDWWQLQQQIGSISTSNIPTTLIKAPDDEWILWPTPLAAGTVQGDWWVIPFELINADDEPCWKEYYHPLLKWSVIMLYASEFGGEGSGPKLLARAQQMLPALMTAFYRDYHSAMRGAPSLF